MLRFLITAPTIPDDVLDQGKELLEAAKADPVLLAVLVGVGVITLGIFFWGIAKQLFKAAIIAGLLSVGVWYWYFNIR